MAPFQAGAGVLPSAQKRWVFVYDPDSPGCRRVQASPKAPNEGSPSAVQGGEAQKKDAEAQKKEATRAKEEARAKEAALAKEAARAKTEAEARKKEKAREQVEALKKALAVRKERASANNARSVLLKPSATRQSSIAKNSEHRCDVARASSASPAKLLPTVSLSRAPPSLLATPITAAPASGMKKPEPPPPHGKDYAAHKAANDARLAAEAEVDRVMYAVGGRFGKALGEVEAGFGALDIKYFPGMTSVTEHLSRSSDPNHMAQTASLRAAYEARLATELSALAELPTYDDPKLADIAKRAFERGYGARVEEAKLRAFAIDLAFTTAMSLTATLASAVERAAQTALKAALTKIKSMPIFVPTAAGGGGGFLRIPKTPCAATGAGAAAESVASEAAAVAAELKPYGGPGGGHHVPAKAAFEGAAGYNPNTVLAIPNEELARLGVSHGNITKFQQQGYRAFAQSGEKLTWDAMAKIETEALTKAGFTPEMASATVRKAIRGLQGSGVAGPTRVPWGR